MNKTIAAILALGAALLSCSHGNIRTTRISGTFSGENVPDSVDIQYWTTPDESPIKTIRIPVTNGRFEAEISSRVTQFSEVLIPGDIVAFIADGSTLAIDMETHQVTSSNPDGVQSRFNAWRQEEQEAVQKNYVQEEYHQRLVTIHRNAIQQNPDNITGAMALSALEGLDPKVALSLVSTLSEEMKQNATVQAILPTLEARARTSIGDMFTDFEVVQDPADPHSAVKLSDYVGKGKTILLVFWASWCEENRKEMPGLKNIYEKYHGDDFDIVSIAVSDAPENSLAAAKEMGITWNLIVNAQIIPLETYGVRRIPDMILFGPDGTILLRNFWGYDDLILDSIIGKYLRGDRPAQPGVL